MIAIKTEIDIMAKFARVDRNQAEIVGELRKLGYHVTHTYQIGGGVPDIIVTGRGKQSDRVLALLTEIKAPGGKLTPDEVDWHGKYPDGGPLVIAYSAADVIGWFDQN